MYSLQYIKNIKGRRSNATSWAIGILDKSVNIILFDRFFVWLLKLTKVGFVHILLKNIKHELHISSYLFLEYLHSMYVLIVYVNEWECPNAQNCLLASVSYLIFAYSIRSPKNIYDLIFSIIRVWVLSS